jgi:hypothetical protein
MKKKKNLCTLSSLEYTITQFEVKIYGATKKGLMKFDSENEKHMKFHTKTKQQVERKKYQELYWVKNTTLITTNSMVYIHLNKRIVYSGTEKVPRDVEVHCHVHKHQ